MAAHIEKDVGSTLEVLLQLVRAFLTLASQIDQISDHFYTDVERPAVIVFCHFSSKTHRLAALSVRMHSIRGTLLR